MENTYPLAHDDFTVVVPNDERVATTILTEYPVKEKPAVFVSVIPEEDNITWQIAKFSAFRGAAAVAALPALTSPEFGRGCRMKLWPNDREHITAKIEIAACKLNTPGLVQFFVSVVRREEKEVKVVLRRQINVRIKEGKPTESPLFRLSRKDFLKAPKFGHLIHAGDLTILMELKYFPHDAPIFRGPAMSTVVPETFHSLLRDVEDYCRSDRSQNVHIKAGAEVFPACRFLLAARSKKFRELLLPFSEDSKKVSLVVKDVIPEVFEQTLQYIHTDTCEWMEDCTTPVANFISLFQAANGYEVKCLKDKTSALLASRLNSESLLEIFECAETAAFNPLQEQCAKFMDTLPGSHVASLMRSTSASPTPRITSP